MDTFTSFLEALREKEPLLLIHTDLALREGYSRDYGAASEGRGVAEAVLLPTEVHQVQSILASANTYQVPVVSRGSGTSVTAGAAAYSGTVVLCLERMTRIVSLNVDDEIAVVQPGVINDTLDRAAREQGLMYAPDPASFDVSTIGGNVATNAGGLRCAKYGVTRDSVLALDVVLADGSLIHTGTSTFKGVAGYDLTSLFVGSEGTLGVVVGITVRLRYAPLKTRTLAVFFSDVAHAARGVSAIARARVQPAVLELLDGPSLAHLDAQEGSSLHELGESLLLIQTDGYGADLEAEAILSTLSAIGGQPLDTQDESAAQDLLSLRRKSRGADSDTATRVGEDVAVPRSQLVPYIDELSAIASRRNVQLRVIAHAGDGNLHPTFWTPESDAEAVARLNNALDDSVRAALKAGGTITGEHGVGEFKRQWLTWEQSEHVGELQQQIKKIFDPRGILNPGKAI